MPFGCLERVLDPKALYRSDVSLYPKADMSEIMHMDMIRHECTM